MKSFSVILSAILLQDASAFFVQAPNTLNGNTQMKMSTNFYAAPAVAQTSTSNSLNLGLTDIRSNVNSGLSSVVQPARKNVPEKQRTVWDAEDPVDVQGGSLRTWSFMSSPFDRVQVLMGTEGRPLNANVELWHGPDNTPVKMGVYLEDGSSHPFCAIVETPRDGNTIAIRNTGGLEFPLSAAVEPDQGLPVAQRFSSRKQTIQGGALKTYPFDYNVQSVQLLLTTNGRPLSCRIELLQGPNNDKQVMEVYTEDGMERPFHVVLATPGTGNVVRIVNTAPVEFPLLATIEPYHVE